MMNPEQKPDAVPEEGVDNVDLWERDPNVPQFVSLESMRRHLGDEKMQLLGDLRRLAPQGVDNHT